MYISIKTKFILLISIVIALVLILQFYYTNQTEKDIFAELTHLSSSINEINYELFLSDSIQPKIRLDSTKNGTYKQNHKVIFKDSLVFMNVTKDASELNKVFMKTESSNDKNFNVVFSSGKSKKSASSNTKKIKIDRKTIFKGSDSLRVIVEEINIGPEKKFSKSTNYVYHNTDKNVKSISFVMPNIGLSKEPKILKYNYSLSTINTALSRMHRKNLIITFLIFIFAIILVVIITKRFLKPIDSLKNSFNKVIEGDLDVNVQYKSNDEIGDLTYSFNYMVEELKKNRQKKEMLDRKERLASLGQLAAGVAHEVKNPLNAINLTIEHLNDKFISADNVRAKQYIQTIQEEIQRLDRIVNNFLSYLRTEKLEVEKVEINSFLSGLIKLYEHELTQKEIKLETAFMDTFYLNIDPGKMKTAISNIILNAIQSMPDKGILKISTNKALKEIIIHDSGRGMDKDMIRKSFDLFYTTKSSGSGLGLPTAYKIIKAHNAEINIESEKNKGTTVIINFV